MLPYDPLVRIIIVVTSGVVGRLFIQLGAGECILQKTLRTYKDFECVKNREVALGDVHTRNLAFESISTDNSTKI